MKSIAQDRKQSAAVDDAERRTRQTQSENDGSPLLPRNDSEETRRRGQARKATFGKATLYAINKYNSTVDDN